MSAESMVWGALKAVGVVRRESFTLATFDPETGQRTGSVDAHEVAAEVVKWLGLCSKHAVTDCDECAGEDEEVYDDLPEPPPAFRLRPQPPAGEQAPAETNDR